MAWMHPAAIEERRRRFTRADAHRYLKPDPERWLSPEELCLEYPELYERKYGRASSRPDMASASIPRDDEPLRRELVAALRTYKAELNLLKLEFALRQKANFNPLQPRHPKNTPLGGRWSGGGVGLPLGPPPTIPKERPPTTREKNIVVKEVARWLARAIRASAPIKAFLIAYEAASWLDIDRPLVEAYYDPPRTMEELRERALTRRIGYDVHHIVEKDSAKEDGFLLTRIESGQNRALIPKLKHWEITGWYMKHNKDYGGLSPREFLRGKSWEQRFEVGRHAMILHGVLIP